MFLKEESSYITGLTNLASYYSKEIGPSYVEEDSFDKESFIEDFSELYSIPKEDVLIEETKLSLEELLKMWFGESNKELIDGLIHWIRIHYGESKKIYEISENSKILNYDIGMFFNLEDVCFVEFENTVIGFYMGNDE